MRTGALLSTEMRNDGGSLKSNYKVSLTNQPVICLSQLNASEEKSLNFTVIFCLYILCVLLPPKGDGWFVLCLLLFLLLHLHLHSSRSLRCNSPSDFFFPRSNDMTNGLSWLLNCSNFEMLCDLFFKVHVGGCLCIT